MPDRSQGKGMTLAAAQASATMESIEFHHAEHVTLPVTIASFSELENRGAHVVDQHQLPRRQNSRFNDSLRIPWVTGSGLVSGQRILVPFEMVDMDCVRPRPFTTGCFYGGTSGLASGNCREEAIAHALFELIERDAMSLWWHQRDTSHEITRVDLATIGSPQAREILHRFDAAGVNIAVWDISSDLAVAAFRATAVDGDPHEPRRLPVTGGHGCHLDRDIALCRALTEAAQARLTQITGSRDDISRASIEASTDAVAKASFISELFTRQNPSADYRQIETTTHDFLESDIETVLGLLGAAGLPEPVCVDLTDPQLNIPVVKIIAPGLEPNPMEATLAGHRLTKHMERMA